MTTIRIRGVVCRLNATEWECDDPELRPLLPTVEDLDRRKYYPSLEYALADMAVTRMGGEIVKQSPPPALDTSPDVSY